MSKVVFIDETGVGVVGEGETIATIELSVSGPHRDDCKDWDCQACE